MAFFIFLFWCLPLFHFFIYINVHFDQDSLFPLSRRNIIFVLLGSCIIQALYFFYFFNPSFAALDSGPNPIVLFFGYISAIMSICFIPGYARDLVDELKGEIRDKKIQLEQEEKKKNKKKKDEKRKDSLIKKYGKKDGIMIFSRKISEKEYLRKKELIKKYGIKFGESIFNKKALKGMTLQMVEECLGEKTYIYKNKYYFGRPFEQMITFENNKLNSVQILDKSIWIDMPKDMLLASWGNPDDEKEDVAKDKVKLKWYFGARQTRQKTTVYKYEIRLENDLVVGWREL
tara:strand:- start:148 stop:1011 length:864 start_codon:yes stop_codon:yes gene_type:complete